MTTYLDVALHRRYGDAAKRYGHRKQSQTVRLVERFVLAAERVATGTATDEDRAFIREVESAPGIEC